MPDHLRLCIVMNHARTVDVLHRNLFEHLIAEGFEITAITPPSSAQQRLRDRRLRSVGIPLERRPSLFRDLWSLVRMWCFFLRNRFDVIHVSTPKAGLIGALAAVFAGQFRVVYTIRGRAYENKVGFRRWCYSLLERLVCRISRHVLVISNELRQSLLSEGTCSPQKSEVLGHGSSNGIDYRHFSLDANIKQRGASLKESLGIPATGKVILNVGRLTPEKGIPELVEAFLGLPAHLDAQLVLVGVIEQDTPLSATIMNQIESCERIHVVGWLHDVRDAFAMAHVFAFPTHREGFGNVAIEAAAMELPVIANDVIGVRESVADGYNGILVPMGDAAALRQVLADMLSDHERATLLGQRGRIRAVQYFAQLPIWEGLIRVYRDVAGGQR